MNRGKHRCTMNEKQRHRRRLTATVNIAEVEACQHKGTLDSMDTRLTNSVIRERKPNALLRLAEVRKSAPNPPTRELAHPMGRCCEGDGEKPLIGDNTPFTISLCTICRRPRPASCTMYMTIANSNTRDVKLTVKMRE